MIQMTYWCLSFTVNAIYYKIRSGPKCSYCDVWYSQGFCWGGSGRR